MKIPTPRIQPLQHRGQVGQPAGDKVADTLSGFQLALHLQQLRVHQFLSLAFGEAAPDDDVNHAVFVFEGDEGDAAGGAGALTASDQTCDLYPAVVGHVFEL